MDHLFLIVLTLCICFFFIALIGWYDYISKKQEVKTSLKDLVGEISVDSAKKRSIFERLLSRLFKYADDFSDIGERFNFYSESEDVYKWLVQANHPFDLTVKRFQGLKIVIFFIGVVGGLIAYFLYFPFAEVLLFLLPFSGFFAPIFWVKTMAKKRQDELSYTLPDFLDMVSVTLKAGASIDHALVETSKYFDGPIKEEFTRYNNTIRLGTARLNAYQELIERTNVPEFEMVIKSLIRGSQLGVPVATTFEIQAEEIRKLRKEKAKEAASKASPKVTLITTFVVMPTALGFIGGLLLLNILKSIQDGGGLSIFG